MKNPIKIWWRNKKRQMNESRENEIRASYSISEKDGTLWITHSGDGVKSFPPSTTIDEVLWCIGNMRHDAVCYYRGKRYQQGLSIDYSEK